MAPWITVLSQHTVFTKRVIYKFTFVWYSPKQCTKHRPTSHLVHLYTAIFLAFTSTQTAAHFAGHCLLWPSSSKIFFGPTVVLTTNLGVGWSRVFPASSIYKCVSKSSRTVLVKRNMVTLDVKFLHHHQSTPLLHEYSGPIISAMLGSIPWSPFLFLLSFRLALCYCPGPCSK